jgi:hypothetical protein
MKMPVKLLVIVSAQVVKSLHSSTFFLISEHTAVNLPSYVPYKYSTPDTSPTHSCPTLSKYELVLSVLCHAQNVSSVGLINGMFI